MDLILIPGVRFLLGIGGDNSRTFSLRTQQTYFAFRPKNVAVEVCNPLPPSGSHIEIADRKLNLWGHVRPVELWELVKDVGGCRVAQRFIQTVSSNS